MIRSAVLPAASIFFSAILQSSYATSGDVVRFGLPTAKDIASASFSYRTDIPVRKAKGVVVLVPGYNGDGENFLADKAWIGFARQNRFVLGAFTFVSPEESLAKGEGYYDTEKGSGDAAVAAFKKLGTGRLPVFMYGFSGGAHFTANFAESHPRALRGWCAASFDDKNGMKFRGDADDGPRPPGIIACGTEDERLGAALACFGRGRLADRKLTWLEIGGLGHSRSPALEAFARDYFLALSRKKTPGVWTDIGSLDDVSHSDETARDMQAWLPDDELAAKWRALCRRPKRGIIEHVTQIKKINGYEKLTMFLRLPSGGRVNGVFCLCLLANNPAEIRERIRGDIESRRDRALSFADEHGFAVIAWGSRRLWDPNRNWSDLSRSRGKNIDHDLDSVAKAWDSGIDHFVKTYSLPSSGYLMTGFSGSAQYALRLAMRRPERFLCVHVHVPSSFDKPVKDAAGVLWCLTTGENERGYGRSLDFLRAARDAGLPVIYKAYPGLGHSTDNRAVELGFSCFAYALKAAVRARAANGPSARPDWKALFAKAPFSADIFNQYVFAARDAGPGDPDGRIPIPSAEIADLWKTE